MNHYCKQPSQLGTEIVGHRLHGRGVVLYSIGDHKMVEFTERFEKSVDEMSEDEIRENTFEGEVILGVIWKTKTTRLVPTKDLTKYAGKPSKKYRALFN